MSEEKKDLSDEISKRIRRLLDDYFESANVTSFSKVRNQLLSAISSELDLLFVFKEAPYFELEGTQRELYFQYFSFGCLSGEPLIFNGRAELEDEIEKFEKGQFEKHQSKNCIVYISTNFSNDQGRIRLFNLLKRLIVFYYQNSGSKSHFLKSVSDRIIGDFWDSDTDTDRQFTHGTAVEYISSKLGLNLALFSIQDELVPQDTDIADKFDLIHASSMETKNTIIDALNQNIVFQRDVERSVSKKNRTTGSSSDFTYSVTTFTQDHLSVADDDEIKSFKLRSEYLCIYHSRVDDLSIDRVFISDLFLETFLRFYNDFEEEEFQKSLEFSLRKMEFELGANPVATKENLDAKMVSVLARLFQTNNAILNFCPVCIRFYHPADNSLRLTFHTVDVDDEENLDQSISINEENSASANAFRYDDVFSIWHPRKLQIETEKIQRFGKKESSEFRWQENSGRKYHNFVGSNECSILAIPIHVNQIVLGVIEFSSRSRSNLQAFSDVMEKWADICGDIYRRLELANDRGWLVRMSFLHAARHRIEQIVQEVNEVAPEAAKDLQELIGAASVDEEEDHTSAMLQSRACVSDLCRKAIALFDNLSQAEAHSMFDGLLSLDRISRRNFILLNEFVEALAANRRKHGFDRSGLRIFAGVRSGNNPIIYISYRPKETWELESRVQRICVSPLRNSVGVTNVYSYGLFLLATQVRMSGGWIGADYTELEMGDQMRFGLSIMLNGSDTGGTIGG